MTLDRLLNVLALVTLVEMMVFIGLTVSRDEVVATVRDRDLLLRAVVANYLAVPALTVILLLAFGVAPMTAAGFLVLAVCPGGPYGAPLTALGRGNVGTATGLMIVLAGLSPLCSPLLLGALLPLVARGAALDIDVAGIVRVLLVGQLVPLVAGIVVRQWWPTVAALLVTPASIAARLLNVAFLGLVLYVQAAALIAIRPLAVAGMAVLFVGTVGIGWAAGGAGAVARRTMALTTAVRNNAVALVIATGAFA